MMRNLIVLGCAAFLALGLSFSSFAGVDPDTDADGVTDSNDICVTTPDGPALGACNQIDGDADGYGVACDTDLNNNGATDAADLGAMLAAVAGVSTAAETDLNCNGAADAADLGTALADTIAVATPGPSGLACAGTVPCP